jgi:hypothetical protein
MIRAHATPGCGLGVLGRRAARERAVPVDRPAAVVIAPDRLAVEVVRHLNHADLAGFRTAVAPTVLLATAAGDAGRVGAGELFGRLTTLAPRQTLCATRVRPTPAGARVDLEIAWPVASGEAVSSLGTLDLTVEGGRVTALTLLLDDDPAVERAARTLAAGAA